MLEIPLICALKTFCVAVTPLLTFSDMSRATNASFLVEFDQGFSLSLLSFLSLLLQQKSFHCHVVATKFYKAKIPSLHTVKYTRYIQLLIMYLKSTYIQEIYRTYLHTNIVPKSFFMQNVQRSHLPLLIQNILILDRKRGNRHI